MANRTFGKSLKKKAQQLSKHYRKKLKDGIHTFLWNLSDGIIANSPVMGKAPYSLNRFVNNTVIYADNNVVTVEQAEPGGYPPHHINNLYAIDNLMRGDIRYFPRHITVENISLDSDGIDYSYNVEVEGWKHTPPYKPLLRGWKYASSLQPEIAKWFNVSYNATVIQHSSATNTITITGML